MKENIRRYSLAYNTQGETHLDVDFGYDIGGETRRGYYLYCTPVRREDRDGATMVRFQIGKGRKLLLKEVPRRSQKAEAEARALIDEALPGLVSRTLSIYGLKLAKARKPVALYQINHERDTNRVRFESLASLEKLSIPFEPSVYDKVFEGEVEADNLDELFEQFNADNRPGRHRFRSMSVSDVVELKEADGSRRFYFCDAVGFTEIQFDAEKTTDASPERLTVLYVEPGKEARELSIENTLEEHQRVCDTDIIQAVYPFDDPSIVLVCDEEGKLKDTTVANRALYDCDGNIVDIIFGSFFICQQDDEGKWTSLTAEQMERCKSLYGTPKRFEYWADQYHEMDV